MKAYRFLLILLITISAGYSACGQSDEKAGEGDANTGTGQVVEEAEQGVEKAADEVVEKSVEMHDEQVAGLRDKAPAEMAEELWDLLQTENYRYNWKEQKSMLMSGKNDGSGGPSVATYINDIASNALKDNIKPLPPGSIIVKERYGDQNELKSITARINLGGDKPEDINWFFAHYSPDGKVLNTSMTGKGVSSPR